MKHAVLYPAFSIMFWEFSLVIKYALKTRSLMDVQVLLNKCAIIYLAIPLGYSLFFYYR